jgi:hypothetical protein
MAPTGTIVAPVALEGSVQEFLALSHQDSPGRE